MKDIHINDVFTCPECGEHHIEEVRNAVVAQEVISVGDHNVFSGYRFVGRGTTIGYKCRCGYKLEGVGNIAELRKYLEKEADAS
jgi:hypothetical protein